MVSSSTDKGEPGFKIALSLLTGFTFMLFVEQFMSGQSHSHHLASPLSPSHGSQPVWPFDSTSDVEFDVSMAELEGGTPSSEPGLELGRDERIDSSRGKAYPLTLGLVIHSLADGLALGASALPKNSTAEQSSTLSIVVFLALIIHKAPTALALTMSLLATSLPRSECRKHIAVFSAATPFGALLSFAILSLIGAGSEGDWPGIALLISGGTFLYVATVLQPVSHHGQSSAGPDEKIRVAIIVVGMFTPFLIGSLIGHGHEH
ncbi:Zip-domain-containing protein [Rickenella mellea]|uniref:Zip-domain-containing protein n=1 Tax=Rickenella mellea TaxID=50990 RepID=A0A4Y7PTH5_9AGAM|nr:Zip-domain-containing protein [Rickenella mellea]